MAKDAPDASDQYAARAVELLAKAESGGFFVRRASLEHMKRDRDSGVAAGAAGLSRAGGAAGGGFAAREKARLDRPAPPAGPFRETPAAIPGVVQAEEFDKGGEGVAFHDIDDVPMGRGPRRDDPVHLDECADEGRGHNVGGTYDGEWLAYTVDVARDGDYVVDARVAAPGGGTSLRVGFGDAAGGVAVITVPNTGAWQRWRTVSSDGVVRLKAGRQVMRVTLLADDGRVSCNVNWVAVRPAAPASS